MYVHNCNWSKLNFVLNIICPVNFILYYALHTKLYEQCGVLLHGQYGVVLYEQYGVPLYEQCCTII